MTNHLTPEILAGLADGELQTQELAVAQEHLAGCAACTSNALAQTLLKTATARAGQRFTPPQELSEMLSHTSISECFSWNRSTRKPAYPTCKRE